jgi:hypothetical protein
MPKVMNISVVLEGEGFAEVEGDDDAVGKGSILKRV